MEVSIKSLSEFEQWVGERRSEFGPRHIILLSGPLGAGKTQFVKSLVGESIDAMSPTYALHNHYDYNGQPIEHIDLYRLKDEDDLESTGFWDFFDQDKAWVVIEWADRLEESVLPRAWRKTKVFIEPSSDGSTRKIVWSDLA